jgi:serine/threonine-protein kinase
MQCDPPVKFARPAVSIHNYGSETRKIRRTALFGYDELSTFSGPPEVAPVDQSLNFSNAPAESAGQGTGADEDWSGRTIGEFHILRLLGRGGMGRVYLAEQKSLKRKVAIKMLRPELAANRTALQRFYIEAQAVARLNHANIVQIYGVWEQNGLHYMALEYVEGRNLRDYLARKGPPELAIALSLMRQIAAALQRAHEAGFIHRDVKPENILLTRKGEVKVTDFGLSRCFAESSQPTNLTQSGVAMGTPLYMSPEQVQGKNADTRSDIYSFGVTCFHMLAGEPPFRGATAFDVAMRQVQDEPPALAGLRPDLPPELCAMVHKMMEKAPDNRYQSFKDIQRDLNKLRESMAGGNTLVPVVVPISGVMPDQATATTQGIDTATSRPVGLLQHKWFPGIVIAAAMMGLFAGGVTVRLLHHRLTAKEPTSGDNSQATQTDEKPQPVISSEERFMLEASRQFADPNTGDHHELKKGLDFQVDLLVYYLKRHRFQDAESFCQELLDRKYKQMPRGGEHPYLVFARLGKALVQAFGDDLKALDRLGGMIIFTPARPAAGVTANLQIGGVPGNMFDSPELRRLIVEALNRLAIDLHVDHFAKYPQLDDFRKAASPFKTGPKSKT